MHDMHNTIIPEGCYNKSQLSKALSIGTTTLQIIAEQDDFPEPAGFYIANNCNRRFYPYWNLEAVKCYLEGVTFDTSIKKTTMPGPRLEKAPPYAVPAHSRQEQRQCLSFRQVFNLMRTPIYSATDRG
jgi:hypothetical protein